MALEDKYDKPKLDALTAELIKRITEETKNDQLVWETPRGMAGIRWHDDAIRSHYISTKWRDVYIAVHAYHYPARPKRRDPANKKKWSEATAEYKKASIRIDGTEVVLDYDNALRLCEWAITHDQRRRIKLYEEKLVCNAIKTTAKLGALIEVPADKFKDKRTWFQRIFE